MGFKETEIGRIPKEWKVKMIQEIGKVVSGGTPKTKETSYWDGNISWITPKDLSNFYERYIEVGERSITEEGLNNSSTKLLPKGTVLFSSRAPIGYVAIAKKELCTNQGFKNIICNKEYYDNEFLYYMMKNKTKEIENIAGGSTFKEVSGKVIKEFKIPVPALEEQKAIANTLSTLDEKIEVNNQINKRLEEMAQTIFKQWFVDFEFPCLPENYKFLGAGKHCNPEGAGKPNDYDKVLTYNRVGGLPIPDGKSWFVYVLLCDDGSFYKGMTKDLYRRFYEHYTGKGEEWTKIHKPVKVIHYEKFNSQQEARKREEELKSGYGREWIKREYKKYQEGLPAHGMKAGLSVHGMKADLSAHKTHLMMAGEMVESEPGMILDKWYFSKIGDICEIQNGFAFKAPEYVENGIKVMRTLNISNNGYFENINLVYLPKSYNDKKYNKYLFKKFDIALVMVGAGIGKIGLVLDNTKDSLQNQNMWRFRSKVENIPQLYLNYLVREAQKISQNWAIGSARDFYRKDSFSKIKVLIPNEEMLKKFNKIVLPLFEMISKLILENENLIEIRDTLLPKLMSGEIRVPLE